MVMPSNYIAAMENKERTSFPNLARGHDAKPEDYPSVDIQITKEATEAGLTIENLKLHGDGEVPSALFVSGHKWVFDRAWYYWRAKGPGIPPDKAEAFDKEWGKEVRAHGDCVCRGTVFWDEGFATGDYHIDTQEGLNAFVQLLKSIHKPRPKED